MKKYAIVPHSTADRKRTKYTTYFERLTNLVSDFPSVLALMDGLNADDDSRLFGSSSSSSWLLRSECSDRDLFEFSFIIMEADAVSVNQWQYS